MAYKDITINARSEKQAMSKIDKKIFRLYKMKQKKCLKKPTSLGEGVYVFKLARLK